MKDDNKSDIDTEDIIPSFSSYAKKWQKLIKL